MISFKDNLIPYLIFPNDDGWWLPLGLTAQIQIFPFLKQVDPFIFFTITRYKLILFFISATGNAVIVVIPAVAAAASIIVILGRGMLMLNSGRNCAPTIPTDVIKRNKGKKKPTYKNHAGGMSITHGRIFSFFFIDGGATIWAVSAH